MYIKSWRFSTTEPFLVSYITNLTVRWYYDLIFHYWDTFLDLLVDIGSKLHYRRRQSFFSMLADSKHFQFLGFRWAENISR
jgi:hypothetical protein